MRRDPVLHICLWVRTAGTYCRTMKGDASYGPTTFETVLFVVNNIIIVMILAGNTLTLVLLCINRSLRTIPNTFAVCLACADFLMGAVYPVYNVINYSQMGEDLRDNILLCALSLYFIMVSVTVSQLTLLAVSVDRYVAIIHPLSYYYFISQKKTNIAIATIWGYSIFICTTILIVYDKGHEWFYDRHCSLLNQLPAWYYFGIILPHMTVISIITKVLFWNILRVANEQSQQMHNERVQGARIIRATLMKRERKANKMRALVVGIFVLCWLPYVSLQFIIHAFGPVFDMWLYNLLEVTKVLSLSNSFMNPIIYFWKNKDFRQALAACTGCKRLGVPNHAVVPSSRVRRVAVVSADLEPLSTSSPSSGTS